MYTIIFFVLALIPAVVFGVLADNSVINGNVNGIIWLIILFLCDRLEISFDVLVVLALGVLVFQIVAVVNFIRIRKKVREYKENQPNKNITQ